MQTSNNKRLGSIRSNNDNENNSDQVYDEFIKSLQLSASQPQARTQVLFRNSIRKMGRGSFEDKLIREYFENSNSHRWDINIIEIWKVHNAKYYAKFMQKGYDSVDNLLLWHGTTRKNLMNILNDNLNLPISATNGHMFGPGIYFADRMSKSVQYTDSNGPRVLLLCQVALGKK